MPILWGKKYSKEDLLNYSGKIIQLANASPFELVNGNERGTRGVRLYNGAGLDMTVLTDRGMSVYDVSFRSVPLAYKSPVGPVHPSFCHASGKSWLETWPVGFLTPCGLTNVGSPCVDNGEECPLHGKIAGLSAKNVSYGGQWTPDGDYEVFVQGTMRETKVFGENITLTRRIATSLGETQFWIEDTVENEGPEEVPFMFLQHINLGFPLLDEHATLLLPASKTVPRDVAAELGVGQCTTFSAPLREFQEEVYYHSCTADDEGFVRVALINRMFDQGTGLGVYIQYKKEDYPMLVQWKMMKQGLYVCGIEPANCHVEGRVRERERGTLQSLSPGEKKILSMEIGVLHGAKELDSMEAEFGD